MAKQTYLERIQQRLKNNPIIAWSILLAAIVTATAAVVPASRSLLKETGVLGQEPPPLNITLEPLDPRWIAGGENPEPRKIEGPLSRRVARDSEQIMNWGGGSQGLFLELARDLSSPVFKQRQGGSNSRVADEFFESAITADKVVRVWEVLSDEADAFSGLQFYMNVTYDAQKGAPIAIVKEWGLSSRRVDAPQNGIALRYRGGGGASVARAAAMVRIESGKPFNPMTSWVGGHEGIPPGRLVTYLEPGEPAFLLLSVAHDRRSQREPSLGHREIQSLELRGYARVVIAGKSYVIESRNAVYAVTLTEPDSYVDKSYVDNLFENLRPLAFLPRGQTPASEIKRAYADAAH